MDYYRDRLEKGEEEPLLLNETSEKPEVGEEQRCPHSAHGHGHGRRGCFFRRFGDHHGPRGHDENGFRRRHRRGGRFLLAAIILYFLARFVVFDAVRVVDLVKHRRWHHKHGWQPQSELEHPFMNELIENPEDDLPENLEIADCADWSEPTPLPDRPHGRKGFSSTATVSLPLNSDKLFIISRGPGAGAVGGVHIVQSDDAGDEIKVTTVVEFDRIRQLERAKVCNVEGEEGHHGVGIFTHPRHGRHGPPHRRRRRQQGLHYRVLVELPRATGDEGILRIPEFSTDLPFFAQHVDDLSETVHFDTLSLYSKFLPLHIKGIFADIAHLSTGFSPIEGNFVVNKSLIISTTNSPINVNVTLNNSAEKDAEPTKLVLDTTHSHITSNIHLVSTAKSGEGGSFDVVAQGMISPINLNFPTSSLNSALQLSASTTLSPIDISLHPAYEGSFSLATSFAPVHVDVKEDLEDPAKKDRKRSVQFDHVGGPNTKGTVEWEEGGSKRGTVDASTTFGPVKISL